MKKRFLSLLLSVACALTAVCAFVGCEEGEDISEVTFEERKAQILADFLGSEYCPADVETDDLYVVWYFGTYKKTDVMQITYEGDSYMYKDNASETVDGILFEYNYEPQIYAYNGGVFYKMQGAVDKGLLTHNDVENIYNIGCELGMIGDRIHKECKSQLIIHVTLTNEASLQFKDYTVADFPDIKLLQVVNSVKRTPDELAYSEEEKLNDSEKILAEEYNQKLTLMLKYPGEENILAAVEILNKMDIVERAAQFYRMIVQ